MTRSLRTDRLMLRPVRMAEAEALRDAIDDFEIVKWLTVVPYPYSLDDARWFIGEVEAGRDASFGIFHEDRLCGMIGISNGSLGYWLSVGAQGKGFATEAGLAVVRDHFTRGGGDLVSAYFEENDASASVLRKLGFRAAGETTLPSKARGRDVASITLAYTRAMWDARADVVRAGDLVLRPCGPMDPPNIQPMADDWDVIKMTAGWPWPSDPAFTASRCGSPFDWTMGLVGAVERDGELVGLMGVSDGVLGYMFARPHWGKGYATQIGRAVLAAYFQRFPDRSEVRASVWWNNPASARVLEKLGFERIGTSRRTCVAQAQEIDQIDFCLGRARHDALRNTRQ